LLAAGYASDRFAGQRLWWSTLPSSKLFRALGPTRWSRRRTPSRGEEVRSLGAGAQCSTTKSGCRGTRTYPQFLPRFGANYGADGQPVSDGHKARRARATPLRSTTRRDHFVQFWDGRAPDVEEQAKGPVMNPVEMAMSSPKAVVAVLKSMPEYCQTPLRRPFPRIRIPSRSNNTARAIRSLRAQAD